MKKTYTYIKFKLLILSRNIVAFGIPIFMFVPLFLLFSYITLELLKTSYYSKQIVFLLQFTTLFSYRIKTKERDVLKLFFKQPFWLYLLLNFILSIPFVMLTLYFSYYDVLMLILGNMLLLSIINLEKSFLVLDKMNLSFLMPNVAFTNGLRKYWYIHVLGTLIVFLGIAVNNNAISIIGFFIFIMTFGFYFTIIEPTIWIFHYGLKHDVFLKNKMISIVKIISIISLPLIITLSIYTKELTVLYLTPILLLGVINQFLSKYAHYYNSFSVQLSQSVALAITVVSCIAPYFLILQLAYFYYLKKQALKTLNQLL